MWCGSVPGHVPLHFGFGNGCVCHSVFCMISCEWVARSLSNSVPYHHCIFQGRTLYRLGVLKLLLEGWSSVCGHVV